MAELGVAYISVIPDTSKLATGIKGAAGPAADSAGRESGKRFGGRFSSAIGGALKTAGKAGLVGAGIAAGATILGGVRSAIDQEKSEATLAGLYGSARTASKLMKDLKKVASTSTIDYTTYAKTAEALAYMGIEGKDAPKMLENIGDAISGAGGGGEEMDRAAEGLLKMVNAGKVELDSLNQLSDAGVPIYSALASQQGKSIANVRQMVTEGKIGIEDVQSAIANAEGKSFKRQIKAAKQVERTLSGRFKILKDNVVSSLGTMFQPGIRAAGDFVGKVNAALFEGGGGGGFLSRFKGMAAQVGNALQPLWKAAKGVFSAIADAARDIIPALINIGKGLAPLARFAATAAIGALVVSFRALALVIRAVGTVIGWVGSFAKNHTTTFRVLAGVILGSVAAWKAFKIAQAGWAAAQRGYQATLAAMRALHAGWNLQMIRTRVGLVALKVQTVAQAVAQRTAAAATKVWSLAQAAAAKVTALVRAAVNSSTLSMARQRVVAVATAVAQRTAAAATRVWTLAQVAGAKAMTLMRVAVNSSTLAMVRQRVATVATAAAQRAAAVGARVFAAAQWLVNAAMRANPIGIVITALTALGVGLVLAYKKSATFRKIVQGAWTGIKKAVSAAWGFIRPILRALWSFIQNTLGPIFKWLYNNVIKRYFQLYGKIISTAWNGVIKPIFKAIGQVLRGDLSGAFNTLKDAASRAFNGVVNAIKAVPGKIRALAGKFGEAGKWLIDALINGLSKAGRFVSDIAGNVWNAVKGMLNAAIGKINDALDFKISIPGPDIRVNIPDIPQLAGGGRVKRSVLAMIGEGREPESVLPDSMLRGLLARAHAGGAQRGQVDNRRVFAAIRVLVDLLRNKVVPALLKRTTGSLAPRRTKTPDTGSVKRTPVRRSGDDAQRRRSMAAQRQDQGIGGKGLLKGFDKPFKKAAPTLKGFQKGMQRSRAETQRLNVAVKKGNSKQVRDWAHLRNRGLKPLGRQWTRTHTSNTQDAKQLDKSNSRSVKAISSTFQRFRRGQLRGFSKDWGTTFRKKTPDDVSTFRTRTGDHMGRTRDTIRKTWSSGIKPTLQTFGGYAKKTVAPAFGRGVDAIGKQWNRIRSKLRGPVKYVVSTVINGALIGAFNKIAKFVDSKEIGKAKLPKSFRTGGVLPGYTPGRDVHTFTSATGGRLHLSGGESIMRPEWTRAVGGAGAVARMNDDARRKRRGRSQHRFPPPRPRRRRDQRFWKGGTYPIPGYPVTNPHGTNYYDSFWAGDMAAPTGTAIRAWKKGVVAQAAMNGEDGSYGNVTVINHVDGNWTRSAHQSAIGVRGGQRITQGQKIGLSGATGNVTGPHLHFEIGGGNKSIVPGGGGTGGFAMPKWVQKIVASPKKWAQKLLDGGDELKGFGYGNLLQDTLNTLAKPSADWAEDELGAAAYSGPMTGAVTRFTPIIKKVLKSLGEPAGATLMSAILARMQQESGGNVGIVNKWDSNWTAGHPSVGLMQVIGPTYQGNKPTPDKGPYKYGTSIDPYSNIYAGLHYARGRYSSIYSAMVKSGGYDDGGLARGTGLMSKQVIEPERILKPRETRSFEQMVRANFRPNTGQSNRLERVEMTITNWDRGTGYIRGIAAEEDGRNVRHAHAMGALR